MLWTWVIVLVSFAYLGVLFAIAYLGDRRAAAGRSIIANPYIYSLSLAVYCTTWTFYGSVGRAASSGVGFLPVYLGPTLMIALWWFVWRKVLRISKTYRITSIADFVAARYGKSQSLGGLVTVIAVLGVIPYISLQLKAISGSFAILVHYPEIVMPAKVIAPFYRDSALYIAVALAVFTVLFGARHLDATERHEGLVAAIAFESLVKLLAFLAVGAFVTFGMYRGFADVFRTVQDLPSLRLLMTVDGPGTNYGDWAFLTVVSMLSIMFLPRQFQISVVENVDENHLAKAIWLFPLYLLLINVFVLPLALGGLVHFGGRVDADTFVLTLPMASRREGLALFAFLGGLSAGTGMVIVESIALSTMICNDLVMPVLLRQRWLRLDTRPDLSGLLLSVRRWSIAAILLLGYVYFRAAGEAYALVAIGLISFAAVAQFAPPILGGIYWKGATRAGAMAGLSAGFVVWAYTLVLPSFAKSGWLPARFLSEGLFGITLLRPQQLFGLTGLDEVPHALFWSMLANVGLYVGVSLAGSRPGVVETSQAALFVDVFRHTQGLDRSTFWRGSASPDVLLSLLGRFLGPERAREAFLGFARRRGRSSIDQLGADAELVQFAETQVAGAIGAASARVMVASVVHEEPPGLDEVMDILDEASQVRAYSRQLELKSRELEAATAELRAANAQLQVLDRLKDDFMATVTHELRTPLTSIRAFSEILRDAPDAPVEERQRFLAIVVRETERLTRLINQMLDLAKIESGNAEWHTTELDVDDAVRESVDATSQLFREKGVALSVAVQPGAPRVRADRDRLIQVLINLLSNAVKFSPPGGGRVEVRVGAVPEGLRVDVRDNGPGIDPAEHATVFEKFRQVGDAVTGKPSGTGLGLPISKRIVEHFGGRLWVESDLGRGATFSFVLPTEPGARAAGAEPARTTG